MTDTSERRTRMDEGRGGTNDAEERKSPRKKTVNGLRKEAGQRVDGKGTRE